MTDTEFDIDETERALENEIPGPWSLNDVVIHGFYQIMSDAFVETGGYNCGMATEALAKFCVYARTALPAACKKIRELQAEIERLRAER